ncbi:Uncharacterized protein FWK35_00022799 [Aphis craccivora]|uniref:Uncharacterized protein n=1 Tax=Aphis craccivora TaxID=307492 RepID=A0A6G0XT08_APHCR|nr:Uncharacterized protein FWK35_00022799 [Aphis craccivora]
MNLWNLPNSKKDAIDFFKDKDLLPTNHECKTVIKKYCTLEKMNFFGNVTSRHVNIKPICVWVIGLKLVVCDF